MRVPGQLVDPAGPRTRARVATDNLWTRLALGHVPESPGIAGRTLRPSDPGARPPGQPADHAGPRTRARGTRDSWSTPRALGHGPESPWTPARHRGPSDKIRVSRDSGQPLRPLNPGPCTLVQVVEPAGYPTRARFAWEGWSNLRAVGPECQSPGTDGLHRGPMDLGPSHQGQLVDLRGPRKKPQDLRDSW